MIITSTIDLNPQQRNTYLFENNLQAAVSPVILDL
jgi:hypothetical protein